MRVERAEQPSPPTPVTPKFRIVARRAAVSRNPEVRVDAEWLCVTVGVPEIPQKKFRYSISKRYLLLWSDGDSHARHHFLILPRPVDPHDHTVTFTNGVVDARIRIRTQ